MRSGQRSTWPPYSNFQSTPRGMSAHATAQRYGYATQGPSSTMPTAFSGQGRFESLGFVKNAYPAMAGAVVQPESTRWPILDDRFDSPPFAPRKRCATPRPNFYTLREDALAWQGGTLTHLRGGKTFTLPSKLIDRTTPRLVRSAPTSRSPDRASVFHAATDWSWCGGPAAGEPFAEYKPRVSNPRRPLRGWRAREQCVGAAN